MTGVSTRRKMTDRAFLGAVCLATLLAIIPLVSVLWMVVEHGMARFDPTFFTHSMRNIGPRDANGGAYHAIIGTLEMVALACLIALPIGILTAIYLVEYGKGRGLARTIGFFTDVLTGLPSIVSGLFVLSAWIIVLGFEFSGFAGSLTLAILMVPVVVRSTEEMIRLVPDELREASLALGVPKWRTILRVVLPTALPGIVTGVILAIARIAGETAPLLLVCFFTDSINNDPFGGPQIALPQFIFDQAGKPNDTALDRAWTGALTLIIIVMLLNLIGRLIARRWAPATSR